MSHGNRNKQTKTTQKVVMKFSNYILNSLIGMIALSALVGCAGGSNGSLNIPTANTTASAPIRLGNQSQPQALAPAAGNFSIRTNVDEMAARRAINNYRINKKARPGPYKYAAADLNGDGQAELIVYFTGPEWCARTGCTLAIMSPSSGTSYETVSTVRRVKPPVTISAQRTNGWHDIHIRAGVAAFPKSHKITLKFSGRGYPGNAVLLTPLPRRTEITGDEIFPPATAEEKEFVRLSISNR